MADFNSSLPIRTESAGDVDIFISDATTPTQKLKVNADGSIDTNFATGAKIIVTDGTDDLEVNADGSVNAVVTDGGGSLTVDGTVDVGTLTSITNDVNIADGGNSITVDAVDLDVRDLVFATDKVDVSGSSVTVTATQLDIDDLDFATDSVDVSGSSVTIADGGNSITVDAVDLDIRDLSASSDSVQANLFDEAGVAFSATNPLPVEVISEQQGDEISNYNTSAAVAKDASVNHDYTVTAAKTFIGSLIWASASGKIKVQVLVNAAVKFVGFNSTANPNIEIPLEKIIKGAATQVIRITITNIDNQAQDVYSTLLGIEV